MSGQVTRVKVGMSADAGRKLIPRDLLNFVEDHEFLKEFTALGLSDDDLHFVQCAIMLAPLDANVVPVSKNVRDLIYQNDGVMAVVRYVFYPPPASIVLLLSAYSGDEILPLTPDEADIAEAYISQQMDFFNSGFTT